jgi:hypothetical protein
MNIAKRTDSIILVAFLVFIGIILLLLPKKELTEKERVKTWKLKDFYLVYQYHFDSDLIELRKEIEYYEMVRNQKVGEDQGL